MAQLWNTIHTPTTSERRKERLAEVYHARVTPHIRRQLTSYSFSYYSYAQNTLFVFDNTSLRLSTDNDICSQSTEELISPTIAIGL